MKSMATTILGGAAMLIVAGTASAHTGAPPLHGVYAGLLHPMLGADHLLAMVAAGLWSVRQGSAARWLLPSVFLLVMGIGGALGVVGLPMTLVEIGVAGSVLVFGLLLALSTRLPLPLGAGIVALFALLHGHAHGSELAAGSSAFSYAAGFLITTSLLLATGAAVGALAAGRRGSVILGRLVATAGAVLMIAAV